MSIQLSAADIALTKSEEGFVDHKYWDPYGDVWTIGYGTTTSVLPNMPETCTEAQATAWLLGYMNRSVVPAILAVYAPANGNELGGLADLGYNAGSGVFREEPMYSALRSKEKQQIANAFMAFDHDANGDVLSDLSHRRDADAGLFLRVPPTPPTYHYDWYLKGGERTAAVRYDHWRKRQTSKYHPHRVWLLMRKLQCAHYSRRLASLAHRQAVHGQPAWSKYHRGWRHVELAKRGKGQLVKPS